MNRPERLARLRLKLAEARAAAGERRTAQADARITQSDMLAAAFEPPRGCLSGRDVAALLRFADRIALARPVLASAAVRARDDAARLRVDAHRATRALDHALATLRLERARALRRTGR